MSDEKAELRLRNLPLPEPHLIALGLGLVLDRLAPASRRNRPGRRGVLGLAGILSGLAVILWATRSAGSVDLEEPRRLVTEGPYARSRHPMYVGWTAVYLGVALVAGRSWLWPLFPLVLVAVDREARREEERLVAMLGPGYIRYRSRVRRYL